MSECLQHSLKASENKDLYEKWISQEVPFYRYLCSLMFEENQSTSTRLSALQANGPIPGWQAGRAG
jgi:hypothetical protein